MSHKSLLLRRLRPTRMRKLLLRTLVSRAVLVTKRQVAPEPAIGVDSCRFRGYITGGWFVERGAYLALATQVWIALPRSSSFLRGWNVGHFHTRP